MSLLCISPIQKLIRDRISIMREPDYDLEGDLVIGVADGTMMA
jgi:hypothetical protein